MKRVKTGGGWPAIGYALRMARRSGGLVRFVKALRTKNVCKTCALGMGGQRGGMVDESGRFPEICKKSMQAMEADMQPALPSEFFTRNDFDALQRMTPRELEHSGRLVEPLLARPGDTHYSPISWQDALTRCADALKRVEPDQSFFYVSGRSSNEAGFLLQLFARLYGTNNVNNCSYFCHQASGVGLAAALGTGTATIVLDDLRQCDLIFLIGANPASNHPRLMRRLVELRRRGGEVIVINPLKEIGLVNFSVPSDVRSLLLGSKIASHYVQPHIGGDLALLTGIAKRIEECGAVDQAFVDQYTEGWEVFRGHVKAAAWEDIVNASGVARKTIDRLADVYARATNVVFAWTMGITHHVHGVDNVRAIVNLALMRGMIGKTGAGMMPIRGHSNVQGVGSVGVTPALKQATFDALKRHFGIELPTSKGMDTLSCIEAMSEGRLRSGLCLGGNLYGASPDADFTRSAMGKLDSMVYLSTTLNTGHAHGRAKETLILPMLPRDEEPQPTTQESMFNFVRLSDGGRSRHVGPRSEVETIARIAHGVLGEDGPIDWRSLQQHRNIRRAIAAVVPGYEGVADIDDTKDEFQIPGRTFHEPRFPTPSGRANFATPQVPAMHAQPNTLRLMTIRSEGQFNTVVYEEHDLYRGQERRDVILMSAEDIHRMGLQPDQWVTVKSSAGRLENILVRPFDIRAGNAAMYYPEANTLVPRDADPQSRTPAYKAVTVTLTAQVGESSPPLASLRRAKGAFSPPFSPTRRV